MPQPKLLSGKIRPVSLVWLDRQWRHVFEDHLPILKKHAKVHRVITNSAREHRGNLYGYLRDQGFEPRWHWYQLRINDLHDPSEFDENRDYLFLVEPTIIEELESKYLLDYHNEQGVNY